MQLLRTTDRPEQKYTLAFVGYGDEREHAVLELTYNYGVDRYDLGTPMAISRLRCPMPRSVRSHPGSRRQRDARAPARSRAEAR